MAPSVNKLDIFDFIFILSQTTCLINKRPIAFKESLRDSETNRDLPAPITPETLLRGHDMVTLNILPSQNVDVDPDWDPTSDAQSHIKSSFLKLNKNRENLTKIYQDEFLADLTRQATNLKERYIPVKHQKLEKGDIVLLKEPLTKSINFPMGRVKEVTINTLGEVTDAIIMKGNRETVKRHVKSLVLLLKASEVIADTPLVPDLTSSSTEDRSVRPKRKAAMKCKD